MEQIRNVQATELRLPFTERGALRLFVRADPYVTRLGGSIAVLLRLGGRVSSRPSGAAYFLRHSLSKRSGRSWGSLAGSLVLHSSLVALVAYLSPRVAAETHRIPASFPREIIYYRIPLQQAVKLPHLGAQPRGNDSSAAHHPDTPAALPPAPARATVATIFSRPAHPDNSHQTIYQSVAPPDLKIKTDQALPNVVALSSPEKPKFALAPQFSRPSAVDHSIDNVTSPTLSDVTSQVQLQVIAPASDSLLPAPSSPVARGPRQGPSADAADLVIISVDASNSAAELALPAGNRWGDFSTALLNPLQMVATAPAPPAALRPELVAVLGAMRSDEGVAARMVGPITGTLLLQAR